VQKGRGGMAVIRNPFAGNVEDLTALFGIAILRAKTSAPMLGHFGNSSQIR
jgi:hypothetical protein